MPSVTPIGAQITMSMQTWRGYSAYEIAVQNGFEGTEEEWLASLKGERGDDAATLTVNGKEAVNKNITIVGTDIYVQSGTTQTIADALENVVTSDLVVDDLNSDDTTKPLSAAAGARLAAALAGVPKLLTEQVALAVSAWSDNKQTVNVKGISADAAVIVTAAPDTYVEYNDAGVYCSGQGEGTLTFESQYVPSSELKANVLILTTGEVLTNEQPPEEEAVTNV